MHEIRTEELHDDHIQRSKSMILKAANLTSKGNAAVLGCGRCAEIPLEEMLDLFLSIDLVELDKDALAVVQGKRGLSADLQRLRFHDRDITGLIPRIEREQERICSECDTPSSLLEKLGDFLSKAELDFWTPAGPEKFELIVCSAVLTQLQATVRRKAEEIFINKFPEYVATLKSNEAWKKNQWIFARKLEEAFIAHLDSLLADGGCVYLSDTVHVCWLQGAGERRLATEGAWIATKSADLADYTAEHHTIMMRDAWQWLRWVKEGDYCGRLYGVQAIIYGRQRLVCSEIAC